MPRPLPAFAFVLATATVVAAQPNPRFVPYPEGRFSALAKQSINTYFDAEGAYKAGEYERAGRILTAFWKAYPPGAAGWENAHGEAGTLAETTGANFGSPVCYYALRMLSDCVNWRVNKKEKGAKAYPVTWTVVLVGKSAGVEPRTAQELAAGGGVMAEHTLDPRLAANDFRVLRESHWLFAEYVAAMTAGNLALKVEFVTLPRYTIPVEATSRGGNSAQPPGAAVGAVFDQIPAATRRKTDWWSVIHPSHVPSKYPAFARTEFVTGGMGLGPDGASPCFLIDDLWFTRKPPHLGAGDYTDHERRAYLPQWYQHEFYHHLFRTYPEMRLEAKGHQWFDRRAWPADFVGRIEPDYYHQALHRRFRTPDARPPLAAALRYAGAPDAVLKQLTVAGVVGEYALQVPENDYHRGTISVEKDAAGRESLRWKNAAGVSWALAPDLPNGVLNTGPDNPYFKDGGAGRVFTLVLPRGGDGEFLPQVRAFRFNGSEYVRRRQ